MRQIMLAAVLALASGCSAVFVPEPMGRQPADLSHVTDEWEGTWLGRDGAVTVHVADASNGLVRIAWHETRGGELQSDTADLIVREACSGLYVSVASEDFRDPQLYTWARIKVDDGIALVWPPDVDAFAALVADAALPGATNSQGVVLEKLSDGGLETICSRERTLLRWDAPIVFWKAAR